MTRKMKDSGVEWIGEIPENWEISRLGRYSLLKTGTTPSTKKQEYFDGEIDWFTPSDFGTNTLLTNSNRKLSELPIKEDIISLYPENSILLIGIGATVGKIGYISERAYSNQQITALSPQNIYYKYLLYFMIASAKHIKYNALYTTLPMINNGYLKEIPLTVPFNKVEQKSIADFLDEKTQEIDNIISKTKKAIEEYKKYKQSLITETVTKGLDKNVEMKYSGVEWIGDIPEHWGVVRFRDLFKFGSGLTITKSDLLDEGIKVINYGEIHSKYKFDLDITGDKLKCVDEEYLNSRRNALVNEGDFIFCDTSEDREGSGNCIVVRESNDELIFAGSHTVTAKLIRNENTIYIRYMIMANSVKEQISSTVVGIKVYSITQAILKTIIGVIPPLDEQEEIATHLDKKCFQIDQIISTKEKLIIEMEAYKKSLIYETVTGKREVQ